MNLLDNIAGILGYVPLRAEAEALNALHTSQRKKQTASRMIARLLKRSTTAEESADMWRHTAAQLRRQLNTVESDFSSYRNNVARRPVRTLSDGSVLHSFRRPAFPL